MASFLRWPLKVALATMQSIPTFVVQMWRGRVRGQVTYIVRRIKTSFKMSTIKVLENYKSLNRSLWIHDLPSVPNSCIPKQLQTKNRREKSNAKFVTYRMNYKRVIYYDIHKNQMKKVYEHLGCLDYFIVRII